MQNEVTVIEACARSGGEPQELLPPDPKTIGTSVTSQSEDSFFPYLPGMIPFGLVNATSGPAEFKDARIPLTGFSLLVIGGVAGSRDPLAAALAHLPGRRSAPEWCAADGDRRR